MGLQVFVKFNESVQIIDEHGRVIDVYVFQGNRGRGANLDITAPKTMRIERKGPRDDSGRNQMGKAE